ncbi:MAG: hypothetical protein ABS46_15860 [Cytophagaceae bacterium SCN 52-12]|nr:MAG: hypothetical protein ABS46_15860 [Cytophagaceae bacterium SCN 52-12]
MYDSLLLLHSWWRWAVLASLLIAIAVSLSGLKTGRNFSAADNFTRHSVATVCQIQLLLGIVLYGVSPLTIHFLEHPASAIHEREFRFFGLEHATVMLAAVTVISVGSYKAKRRRTDREKFRAVLTWFLAGLLLVLSSIPWSFWPWVNRPSFRIFW